MIICFTVVILLLIFYTNQNYSINQLLLTFFFKDTAATEIYTLSLHDALPISLLPAGRAGGKIRKAPQGTTGRTWRRERRSEEHTSELQSRLHLVCRLLLEKKNEFNHIQIQNGKE